MVYHAYENGFYTLGRQTLLEPIEWTADGWFRIAGSDPAQPIAKPAGRRAARLRVLDDFSATRWACSGASTTATPDRERFRYERDGWC